MPPGFFQGIRSIRAAETDAARSAGDGSGRERGEGECAWGGYVCREQIKHQFLPSRSGGARGDLERQNKPTLTNNEDIQVRQRCI